MKLLCQPRTDVSRNQLLVPHFSSRQPLEKLENEIVIPEVQSAVEDVQCDLIDQDVEYSLVDKTPLIIAKGRQD